MMHAYDELYLQDAQEVMAYMFDYVVYSLHYELSFFYDMFLKSRFAEKFAIGDPSVVSGMSGIELARRIVEENTKKECEVPAIYTMNKSPEYWSGWALVYYQWYRGGSFSTINDEIPISVIVEMYSPYHEMDIRHFVSKLEEMRSAKRALSYLKLFRQKSKMTQAELAEATDIPIKTIQQYEQRQKNINKAQAEYVLKLAQVLGCKPEQLLEPETI